MKIKKILIIIIIVCCFLTGCATKDSPEDISKATDIEFDYFEEKIFEIIVKYESGDYLTPEDTIDWEEILEDGEKIDKELDNIIINLSSLDVTNDEVREFSGYISNMLISISNEDYTSLLNELTNLYTLIPKYMEQYNENINKTNTKQLKSYILNSFNFSQKNDWANATNEILNAENKYNEMIGDNEYIKENSYTINKKYVLLQEYKNSINSNNIDLVRIKFIRIASEL